MSEGVSRRRFLGYTVTAVVAAVVAGVGVYFATRPPAPPTTPTPTPTSPPPTPTTTKPPVKIGSTTAMTGLAADWGLHQVLGLQLAVEDINKQGGLLGRPVELVWEDDKLSSSKSIANVEKLWTVDKCIAIFGTVSSGIHKATIKRCKELGVLWNAVSSCGDYFRTLYFYKYALFWHTDARAAFRTFVPWFFKEHPDIDPDRFVMTIQDYAMGWSHENLTRCIMERMFGMTLKPENVVKWPLGCRDFTPWFPKLKELAPETLLTSTWGGDSITQFNQMASSIPEVLMGAKYRLGSCCNTLFTDVGEYWAKIKGKWVFTIDGMINTPWGQTPVGYPEMVEWRERFTKRFGTPPNMQSIVAYNGLMGLAQLIEKAGTFDKDAIIEVAEKGFSWKGILGDQYIRPEDHQNIYDTYVCRWEPRPGLGGAVRALYRCEPREWAFGNPLPGEEKLKDETDIQALYRIYTEKEMWKPFPTYKPCPEDWVFETAPPGK